MDSSTTNTAAREVDLALMTRIFNAGYALAHHHTVEGNHTEVHCGDCMTYNRDKVEELLADIRHDESLTQQQGGEQEAGELLARFDTAEARSDMLIVSKTAALNAITAALHTKQPAASEGGGRAAFEKWVADQFGYSTEKMVWDDKQYRFGPTGFLWEAWEASAAALTNTSKQAAGEAVAWAIKDHLGGIVELTASQDKRDQMLATNGGGRPLWTAEPLYTIPPRHPADEETPP